nr:AraC family transcriptional regulator [Vagococcus proximus]
MALIFNFSISYLSRFVKEQTGVTFSRYVQELRLEEIKRRLVETDDTIKEIVVQTGYYDVSNYTRKFKSIVGVTPGQYRSEYKK